MRRILLRVSILILTLIIGMLAYSVWSSHNPPFIKGQDKPLPYAILEDTMTARIVIGVDADISERQLCATLSQAADDHMNDRARDYIIAAFLTVDAYLVKDGRRSAVYAGRVSRYVPPRNPNANDSDEWDVWLLGKEDRFWLNLWRARQSL